MAIIMCTPTEVHRTVLAQSPDLQPRVETSGHNIYGTGSKVPKP